MIVDSHALLWWLEGSPKLSTRAASVFADAETSGNRLIVNPVTFWELRRKQLQGKLETRRPVDEWPEVLRTLFPWIAVIDVGSALWLALAELEWSHQDPADRLIAVTALKLGLPVLTKDDRFHRSDSPVEAVW